MILLLALGVRAASPSFAQTTNIVQSVLIQAGVITNGASAALNSVKASTGITNNGATLLNGDLIVGGSLTVGGKTLKNLGVTVNYTSANTNTQVFIDGVLQGIGAPVAWFTPNYSLANSGGSVTFTNESQLNTNLTWNFGDGTILDNTNTLVTHLYSANGVYAVTAAAVGLNQTNVFTYNSITIADTVASFTGSPTTVYTHGSVTFVNASTAAVSYLWDFGDSSTSTSANPTHSYSMVGTYDVSLTAYGTSQTVNQTRTGYITVSVPSGFPSGAAAYWALDETSGDRMDSTGNGNTATDVNSDTGYSSGVLNNAVSVNFGDQTLNVYPNITTISATGACTYSTWVKFHTGTANGNKLFSIVNNSMSTDLFYCLVNNISSGFINVGTDSENSSVAISFDNWHNIVFVRTTGVSILVYLDGSLVRTCAENYVYDLGLFTLLDSNAGTVDIDESCWFNRALTYFEVLALAANPPSPYAP